MQRTQTHTLTNSSREKSQLTTKNKRKKKCRIHPTRNDRTKKQFPFGIRRGRPIVSRLVPGWRRWPTTTDHQYQRRRVSVFVCESFEVPILLEEEKAISRQHAISPLFTMLCYYYTFFFSLLLMPPCSAIETIIIVGNVVATHTHRYRYTSLVGTSMMVMW